MYSISIKLQYGLLTSATDAAEFRKNLSDILERGVQELLHCEEHPQVLPHEIDIEFIQRCAEDKCVAPIWIRAEVDWYPSLAPRLFKIGKILEERVNHHLGLVRSVARCKVQITAFDVWNGTGLPPAAPIPVPVPQLEKAKRAPGRPRGSRKPAPPPLPKEVVIVRLLPKGDVKVKAPKGEMSYPWFPSIRKRKIGKLGTLQVGDQATFFLHLALVGDRPTEASPGTPEEWIERFRMDIPLKEARHTLDFFEELGLCESHQNGKGRLYDWRPEVQFQLEDLRQKAAT